jgi:predicted RNase H-like nuclease (RuvC/YqgF family)
MRRFTFMTDKDKATDAEPVTDAKIVKAKNPTVAADIAMLTAQNMELKDKLQVATDENKEIKTMLEEANARMDAAIRTTLYPQITSKMNIVKAKLDEMKPAELHELNQTLNAIKADAMPRGRPNVIGSDTITRATIDHMPDLYGKSRTEILKELGAA